MLTKSNTSQSIKKEGVKLSLSSQQWCVLLPPPKRKINQFRFNNFQFSGCGTVTLFPKNDGLFLPPQPLPPPPKKKKTPKNFLKSALKESWHLFDPPPCSKVTYIAARPGIYRASVFGLRHGWTSTRGKSEMVTRDLGGGKFGNKWGVPKMVVPNNHWFSY